MKNLFIIIILSISLFAYGCGSGSSGGGSSAGATSINPPTINTPVPTPGETDDTTPDVGTPDAPSMPISGDSNIKLAANLSGNLYFLEGDDLEFVDSGAILKADTALYAVDDELVTYDASGDPVESEPLPVVPTQIKSAATGVFFCDEYTKQEAYDLGGLYRNYSEIYKDDVIISTWFNNQYECRSIVAAYDSVFVIDQNNSYNKIEGSAENVQYVEDNAFVIHSRNDVLHTIMFNDSVENYQTNNILNATQWILHEGLYYSGNGYTWSEETGLTELATAMQAWQNSPYPVPNEDMPFAQSPVLLKIGIYMDNLYYVECNTGWLFKYDPVTDTLTQNFRLYVGTGMRADGIERRSELKPTLTDNFLYYRDAGVIMKLNLDSGIPEIFVASDGETMEF